MGNPFKVVARSFGSFADWVLDNNARVAAYDKYGPGWREILADNARKRQLEIEKARIAFKIKQRELGIRNEDLRQEKLDTLSSFAETGAVLTPGERLELMQGLGLKGASADDEITGRGSTKGPDSFRGQTLWGTVDVPDDAPGGETRGSKFDPSGIAESLAEAERERMDALAAKEATRLKAIEALEAERRALAERRREETASERAERERKRARFLREQKRAPVEQEEAEAEARRAKALADQEERELLESMTEEEIRNSRLNPRRGEDILTRARRIGSFRRAGRGAPSKLSPEGRKKAEATLGRSKGPREKPSEGGGTLQEIGKILERFGEGFDAAKVQAVLRKVEREGVESLTEEERKLLRRLREKGVI